MKNRVLKKLEKETVWKNVNKFCAVSFFICIFPYILLAFRGEISPMTERVVRTEIAFWDVETSIGSERIYAEDYLVGMLSQIVKEDDPKEFQKAMAVVLRSNLYCEVREGNWEVINENYRNFMNLKALWGEDYTENYHELQKQIAQTAGMILTYNANPIRAPYFALGVGFTRDGRILDDQNGYLLPVDCTEDALCPEFAIEVRMKKSIFHDEIQILEMDTAGYVQKIGIGSQSMNGEEFRIHYGLQSANFRIREEGKEYIFHIKGKGHGYGLSTYGARCMAEDGCRFTEILEYYYTGVQILKSE